MKKFICLIASALALSTQVGAQYKCGTDDVYNRLKAENPAIGEVELKLNMAIKEAIEERKAAAKLGKTTADGFDIPIVIHLVHDYGTEYISDDAIFEAVAFWNKVFSATNPDISEVVTRFKPDIGNANIRLHLATKDPSGNPTKGITRRQSYLTSRGSDNAKMDGWPNNQYINIWMINKFSADHSGAAAYAYYPSSGAMIPMYDGVIGLASYLNTDKTYPHELGHVLNLAHTWGSTNDPGVACGDDLVPDTPPTKGHTTCSAADLADVTCSSPDINNTQNIMEYAYCSRMFTKGQVDRMQAALTSSVAGRNNLYSAANLAATGALNDRPDLPVIPDFSVEKGVMSWGGQTSEKAVFLCQGSTTKFSFKNRSYNDTLSSVEWSFSNNPTTASSSEMLSNVTNSFKDAGWVKVTMTVKGNNTATQTLTRDAVYVASNTAYKGGYANYFNYGDFKEWPMFNHYNNGFKWEYSNTNGYPDGYGCIRFRGYDARTGADRYSGNPDGDFDDMYTPAFDLTTIGSDVNLNFFTAGAAGTKSAGNDSLQIFASSNCGDTWVRIAALKSSDLNNNSRQDAEFAPGNASNWKAQTINVPAAQRTDKTFFRFRYWAASNSNNLYFDNFKITPWTTEISEVSANANEIKLFPNPTSGNTKLCFTAGTSGDAAYVIRDVTGKVIATQNLKVTPNTFVQEEISRNLFPAGGVYLITLTQSEQTHTQKLVVE
ncbi:MAG: zinc-dependent metalloprotease [Chitinophagaceae bacterium]|nr:zinc-dependent metalloprotease [Chitinophagaceae bacterium]